MFKKIILILITSIAICDLVACGTQGELTTGNDYGNNEVIASSGDSDKGQDQTIIEPSKGVEPEIIPDFTFDNGESLSFSDLARYSYEFCSGAGGWSTNFTIESDGSFQGSFHDSDLGSTGDDYPNGTMYFCSFNGKFKNLTKLTPYCYEMTMENISYDDEVGKEEVLDGRLYVYTDVYGLEGTDTFKVYLPGLQLSELTEETNIWIRYANNDETTLTIPIIVNEPMEYGIYSYERLSTLEEARLQYSTYKESYDYYKELLSSSETTVDMQINSEGMYNVADELINILWKLIKYNFAEDDYQTILKEQRAWIKTKEERANSILSVDEGGSQTIVDYNQMLAEETLDRCDELIKYIEDYFPSN